MNRHLSPRACLASLCVCTTLLIAAAVGCGSGSGTHPAVVVTIALAPNVATMAPGATQQFTATATYSNGSTQNVTTNVAWSSSATGVATITAGMATAVAAGPTTITASLGGVSGTATLTVTPAAPALSSIAVAPATPSVVTGGTQQFTATGTYSDGSTQNVTATATWSSSTTSVATVSASGLATAIAPGSTTISASLSGVAGTTTLTVTAGTKSLSSITITPANPTFAAGSTQQFTATATYSDGSTQNVTTTATWASSATTVAAINSSGVATGVATGSTTISATLNSVTGSTSATVTAAATGTTNVTTWHFDNNRSGPNPNETTLTPANVAPSTFGKLFSYSIDGYAYAEPLLMSNVSINGSTHDVLYVATENDSVYAFDADNYGTGAPLWQVSLLQSGETPLTGASIQPVLGITSTPVIDPSTNTLYVVSAQTSSAAGGTFRLHALDITTGTEKFGGPVTLNVSVAATNGDSVNGIQTLTTSCIQRAALLLANGNVYIGFGSCHSGWLVAYSSASTLAQVGVFNASTVLDGEGAYASAGGVWMGSGGPVADSSGNVYITTGNGPWNGTNAFADSVLKFGPTPTAGPNGSMQPIDYFTPSIYQYMDCNDADLAAGGLMLIPGTTTLIAGGQDRHHVSRE